MANVINGIKGVKNADKFIIGVKAYDDKEHKWGTIVGYEEELDVVIMEDENGTWYVSPCFVYPIAEGYHLKINAVADVCYEVSEHFDFPYYVPYYNKDFYDFEVKNDSEHDSTNYYDNVVGDICKKLASDMSDIVDNENNDEIDCFNTAYMFFFSVLKTKANADKIAFIKKYVDADVEKLYTQIVSDLTNMALANLLPCFDRITIEERETITNKVKSLPFLDIIHLAKAKEDSEWLKARKKRMDVDKYFSKKKKYKVEGIYTEKLYVEVEAETWDNAKELAQNKLSNYPNSNKNVSVAESNCKIKRWNKERK